MLYGLNLIIVLSQNFFPGCFFCQGIQLFSPSCLEHIFWGVVGRLFSWSSESSLIPRWYHTYSLIFLWHNIRHKECTYYFVHLLLHLICQTLAFFVDINASFTSYKNTYLVRSNIYRSSKIVMVLAGWVVKEVIKDYWIKVGVRGFGRAIIFEKKRDVWELDGAWHMEREKRFGFNSVMNGRDLVRELLWISKISYFCWLLKWKKGDGIGRFWRERIECLSSIGVAKKLGNVSVMLCLLKNVIKDVDYFVEVFLYLWLLLCCLLYHQLLLQGQVHNLYRLWWRLRLRLMPASIVEPTTIYMDSNVDYAKGWARHNNGIESEQGVMVDLVGGVWCGWEWCWKMIMWVVDYVVVGGVRDGFVQWWNGLELWRKTWGLGEWRWGMVRISV